MFYISLYRNVYIYIYNAVYNGNCIVYLNLLEFTFPDQYNLIVF